MQTMRNKIVQVVTTMTERLKSTVVTIRTVTPTLTLKNPEFSPHFFLSVFMTLTITCKHKFFHKDIYRLY